MIFNVELPVFSKKDPDPEPDPCQKFTDPDPDPCSKKTMDSADPEHWLLPTTHASPHNLLQHKLLPVNPTRYYI
jgi:hypothetical protein